MIQAQVIAPDTIAAYDTITAAAPAKGILLTRTQAETAHALPATRPDTSNATSWVTLGIIALFLLIALRYRHNFRFLNTILFDLISARQRRNMFDDTVRETTFMSLMNILSVISIAALLAAALQLTGHTPPPAPGSTFVALWPSVVITISYYLFQIIAYSIIGFIFLPRGAATTWIKGFTSVQTLLGIILFPLAILGIFYSLVLPFILILAGITYLAGRLIFISQGIRIFFTQTRSYVLFLYYLCTIEIVPIFIVWRSAVDF